MKKLSWHTETRKASDLLPHNKNPRRINSKQLSDLAKSLKTFNIVEIPAIDLDNRILAGHQRLKALQMLGREQEEIDVRVPNRKLSEKECEKYLLSSNALGGDWDIEGLKAFDIDTLLNIGFDEDTLSSLWDENLETEDDDFQIEKELQKMKRTDIKPGDLFALGSHRLICGNAHDPKVIEKLMGKERAAMIYNDPIYNIGLSYNKGLGGKQNYGGTVNDKKTDAEYKEFLKQGLQNSMLVAKDDCHYFYWSDSSYIWLIQEIYRELGIENKRVCLWIKNGQNPTPGVAFSKCFEPCTYGVKGQPYLAKNTQNLNEVMNKEITTGNRLIDDILDFLDIWLVKRLAGNEYEHPTAKPPTLHEKAMRRCSKPGDIILDIYAGSGSTLLAGEMLKRKVNNCELEPIFCQLIINRYETYAKQKAKKLN